MRPVSGKPDREASPDALSSARDYDRYVLEDHLDTLIRSLTRPRDRCQRVEDTQVSRSVSSLGVCVLSPDELIQTVRGGRSTFERLFALQNGELIEPSVPSSIARVHSRSAQRDGPAFDVIAPGDDTELIP
jgi:hypothetical protein